MAASKSAGRRGPIHFTDGSRLSYASSAVNIHNLSACHPCQLRSLVHVQYSQALDQPCVQVPRGDVGTNVENTGRIGMNGVDRWIQRKRIAEAVRWMPDGIDVLDVGCADGALFRQASSLIKSGIGVDVDEPTSWPTGPYEFRRGTFPEVLDDSETFDAVASCSRLLNTCPQRFGETGLAAFRAC